MVRVRAAHLGALARMKPIKLTGPTTWVVCRWGVYAGPMLEHPSGLEQSRDTIQCVTGVIVILNGVRNIG